MVLNIYTILISTNHHREYGLYLPECGKIKFAKNYINSLNSYWQPSSSSSYLETNTHIGNILNGNEEFIFDSRKGNLNKTYTENANTLTQVRLKNTERIITGQLNINSLKNKFEYIVEIVHENVDLSLVSVAKDDSFFPHGQFHIQNYSRPYRLDQTEKDGGIILYINKQIQLKLLKPCTNIGNMECLFIEINLGKRKWLLSSGYNPHVGLMTTSQQAMITSYWKAILIRNPMKKIWKVFVKYMI